MNEPQEPEDKNRRKYIKSRKERWLFNLLPGEGETNQVIPRTRDYCSTNGLIRINTNLDTIDSEGIETED